MRVNKYGGVCRSCGGTVARGAGSIYKTGGVWLLRCGRCVAVANGTAAPAGVVGPCWVCKDPAGKFRNLGAASPVWCDACFESERAKTAGVCNVRFSRRDNSSHEDRACGDLAYEDQCARACGL